MICFIGLKSPYFNRTPTEKSIVKEIEMLSLNIYLINLKFVYSNKKYLKKHLSKN